MFSSCDNALLNFSHSFRPSNLPMAPSVRSNFSPTNVHASPPPPTQPQQQRRFPHNFPTQSNYGPPSFCKRISYSSTCSLTSDMTSTYRHYNTINQWRITKIKPSPTTSSVLVGNDSVPCPSKPLVSPGLSVCPIRVAFTPSKDELVRMERHKTDEANAFRKSQLVPRSFLAHPLWSQLVPTNFIIQALKPPSSGTTLSSSVLVFTLEPQPGKILFRPVHFIVTVTGPGKATTPVTMHVHKNDKGKELMYIYYFRPEGPGIYTAKVRLAANGMPHVCQSPLSFYFIPGNEEDVVVGAVGCGESSSSRTSGSLSPIDSRLASIILPRRTASLSSISSTSSASLEIQ